MLSSKSFELFNLLKYIPQIWPCPGDKSGLPTPKPLTVSAVLGKEQHNSSSQEKGGFWHRSANVNGKKLL